ncbi:MAG: hypothetical protein PVI54_17930, partial [Desulfobacteraceae bacterium]
MTVEGVTNNVGTLGEEAILGADQAAETTEATETTETPNLASESGENVSGSDSTYSAEGDSELASLTEEILGKLDQVAEMLPGVMDSLGGESAGGESGEATYAPAEATAEPAVDTTAGEGSEAAETTTEPAVDGTAEEGSEAAEAPASDTTDPSVSGELSSLSDSITELIAKIEELAPGLISGNTSGEEATASTAEETNAPTFGTYEMPDENGAEGLTEELVGAEETDTAAGGAEATDASLAEAEETASGEGESAEGAIAEVAEMAAGEGESTDAAIAEEAAMAVEEGESADAAITDAVEKATGE